VLARVDEARLKIESGNDPVRLTQWALAASDLGDDAFLKLLDA
jgi:hypothetical protein